ncbi:glycosyltransferase, GT2 family [Terrimicrobium sacchariphilum]|uniref:Glycosyltransferase, GT2 family n=1 Tax=Terrimicrobium sacchariphilum TaxID=690879 RepID=A0A146GFH4_TERSA|nr:glycosyltransferase [Terrimicrobium sacchariphilum]GAT35367.1 glycosyltransferase, GT2 family [Terrimicrobium sacchariphilum]
MNAKATLLIPTYQRPRELAECLTRVMPQASAAGVETIICDDSRDDETRKMLSERFPLVRHIVGPRRGPAANRNAGARAASGEWLIFLDDDCEPGVDFLRAYLEEFGHHSAEEDIAFEGATIRQGSADSLLTEAPHNPGGGALISCNFAISRRAFLEAGAFDERFPMAAFEDTEFAARWNLKGGKVVFLPKAVVGHPLRSAPPAGRLARRWESRVISTYDFGGTTAQVAWRLPRHVLLVILSRFRGRKWSGDNIRAAGRFAAEYLFFLGLLPGWLMKYHAQPRSPFWLEQQKLGRAPRKLGL